MLNIVTYYRFMASSYTYYTTLLKAFAVLWTIIMCVISSKRLFIGLIILGTLGDAILAYIITVLLINCLKRAEHSSISLDMDWLSQVLIVFVMLPCVSLCISIFWIVMNKFEPWSKALSPVRACYIVHFLFSSVNEVFIFTHCVILIWWFIASYLAFLWKILHWIL